MSDKNFYIDIILEEKFIPDDTIISCENSNLNQNLIVINNLESSLSSIIESGAQNERKGKKFYKCKCGKIYTSIIYRRNHEKICPKFQNQDLIVCRRSYCHQIFTNKSDYENHKASGNCIRKHSKVKKYGIFSCNFEGCYEEFSTYSKLYTHRYNVHVNKPKYPCRYCDLSFKYKCYKQKHEQNVHLEKRSKFQEKKVNKSKDFKVKSGHKIKLEIDKIEINQESDDCSEMRVTRSRNKDTNLKKFFEEEIKQNKIDDKTDQNFSDSEGSNTDSTTSTSSISFDEANLDHEISKSSKISKNVTNKLDETSGKMSLNKIFVEFKCEYENCSIGFNSKKKYNYHIDRVHLNIRYENDSQKKSNLKVYDHSICFLCRKHFSAKKDLVEHMELPHKIKCPKCAMIFVQPAQLERHTAFKHPDPNMKKVQCPKCPLKFKSNIHLHNHERRVHMKKMKICPFCLDKISTGKLKTHFETHKTASVKKIKEFCEVCQIYLSNKEKLAQHKKTELHLRKISGKIKGDNSEECILPDDVHSIESILAQNQNEYKARKYRTKDKGIVNPEDFEKMKPNSKKAVRTCAECGLKFRNLVYRTRHMEFDHGHEKPLVFCEICDVTFVKKANLNLHLKHSKSHKRKELEAKS